MLPHGEFCWTDLMTWDVEAAKVHYTKLFGWTYEPSGRDDGFWFAFKDGRRVAGLYQMTEEKCAGLPPHWFSYIGTDDLESSLKAIVAGGGMTLCPPFDVPNFRIALVKDCTGAAFGLMQHKVL